MRIYVIPDHTGYNKTILTVVERWREQGHEVIVDMYYDRNKADWCDIIFGEYIQGGVVGACQDADMKKPIVVRGIDIDLYYGHYAGIDLNKCKALLFINEYMRDYVVERYELATGKKITCPIKVVKLGIDPLKWEYRDRTNERGKKIGWINGFWSGKGVGILLQAMTVLIDKGYEFEVVGELAEPWLGPYYDEFIKRNGFETMTKRIRNVESVDKWMNGMDYIMSTSMKECMSLPLLEGMAKGIKPLIHNWWGADQLYPKEFVWNSVNELPDILDGRYDSPALRQFVIDNYSLDRQVRELNEVLGI